MPRPRLLQAEDASGHARVPRARRGTARSPGTSDIVLAARHGAPFHAFRSWRKRKSVSLRPLKFLGTRTQPSKQDIQVAHFAEHPGQPLEFALEAVLAIARSTRSFSARSSLRNRREADRRRCTPSGSPRLASGSCAAIREIAVHSACTTASPAGSRGLTRGPGASARCGEPAGAVPRGRRPPRSVITCCGIFRTAEFPCPGTRPRFRNCIPVGRPDLLHSPRASTLQEPALRLKRHIAELTAQLSRFRTCLHKNDGKSQVNVKSGYPDWRTAVTRRCSELGWL